MPMTTTNLKRSEYLEWPTIGRNVPKQTTQNQR